MLYNKTVIDYLRFPFAEPFFPPAAAPSISVNFLFITSSDSLICSSTLILSFLSSSERCSLMSALNSLAAGDSSATQNDKICQKQSSLKI